MSTDTARDATAPPAVPASDRPGGMIGGRYRLTRMLSGLQDRQATAWVAEDTVLQRPVRLDIHRPGGDAARGFLDRSLAAGAVGHPALARVLDVVEAPGCCYAVSGWPDGPTLAEVLRDGALDPDIAAAMVRELAAGVADAHHAGAVVGGLRADRIMLTPGGPVAVLHLGAADPSARADIRGLGAVLYAALSGRWPLGDGAGGLPGAPTRSGRLCSPRQLLAGVPTDLSTLAMRAMQGAGPGALRTVDTLATVLAERCGLVDLLPFDDSQPVAPLPAGPPPPRRHRVATLGVIALGAIAVVAVVLLLSRMLTSMASSSGGHARTSLVTNITPAHTRTTPSAKQRTTTTPPPTRPAPKTPNRAASVPLRIDGATVFDPYHSPPGHENPPEVGNAFDGNPNTAWHTLEYRGFATFGNLKPGAGLRFDLGIAAPIRAIHITTPTPGITVQVLTSDVAADALAGYTAVTPPTPVSGSTVLTLAKPVTARFVVVWISALVPQPDGQFQAALSEVSFSG